MKIVTRTSVVGVVTLAWLGASTALAAGPWADPSYRNMRYAANPNAQSRVSSRVTSQAVPPATEPEQIAPPQAMEGPTAGPGDPTMWEGSADEGYCDDGNCGPCRNGLWYFSADYLLVRPRLSQGVAEVRSTEFTEVDNSTEQTIRNEIDKSISYCFDYNSSFRVALGYRLLDCGGDIQFSYWRLTGNAQVSDGPATVDEGGQVTFLGQLENDATEDGAFFSANTGVAANIYDIDFAKCLALGGPQQPCDCNFCPRWDLRFQAGVRIGDVTRFNNNLVTDVDGNTLSLGKIDARFTGAGPRIGIQGRRYFGQCGLLSVYAKGSQALLIGDYNMSRVRTDLDGREATQIASQFDSFCRMIPVTDIEIGGSWQVAPYAFVSLGWFWQAWWDLGQAENIDGTNFNALDSANILGFDGLFIRAELLF